MKRKRTVVDSEEDEEDEDELDQSGSESGGDYSSSSEWVPSDDDDEDDDDEDEGSEYEDTPSGKARRPKAGSKQGIVRAPLKPSTVSFASADDVLRPLRKLRQQSAAKRPRLSLKDMEIPDVTQEVEEMDDKEVRERVEEVMIDAATSIMADKGISYAIPARTSSNQLYVPELDRIVLKNKMTDRNFASAAAARKTTITTRLLGLVHELCTKGIHTTKRDLFYTDVKLFVEQVQSDTVLDDMACMIGCTRTSLNVVASEKGVIVGRVTFKDSGDFIDCARMGVGGKAISPFTDRITEITSDAEFILLVEKDAAFMRLAEDRFYNDYPCIIITAKGQPDVSTRRLLKLLKDTLQIPVIGLVDSDPYGLKILSVYMSGSKNMSYDSASLTTSDIKWLGVRPSDLERYSIPQQCRLAMTPHDMKTGRELLKEDFVQSNPEWVKELELMVATGEKAEIQSLSNFGFQYLTKTYLPQKLAAGDWI